METIFNLIELPLLVLIIISSYWTTKRLNACFVKVPLSIKIFILSTALSFVYYYIGKEAGFLEKKNLIELLITYFTATSVYELILKPLEVFFKKLIKSTFKTTD